MSSPPSFCSQEFVDLEKVEMKEKDIENAKKFKKCRQKKSKAGKSKYTLCVARKSKLSKRDARQMKVKACLKIWFRNVFNECGHHGKVDDILEKIMWGGYTLKGPIQKRPLAKILKNFDTAMNNADNDMDRMSIIAENYPNETFIKSLTIVDAALGKNEIVGILFRDKAYHLYRQSKYDLALRCCTLAIMFTPEDSELMGGLYADRVFFLYATRRWEAGHHDAKVALTFDLSKKDRRRVLRFQLEFDVFMAYTQRETQERKARKLYCQEKLFKIYGHTNSDVPAVARCIDLVNIEGKGRGMVTNISVKAGTTIAVEKPYISLLSEQLRWDLRHCANCFKACMYLTSCPGCVFTGYCSKECRLEDLKNGHRYECPCLNYLHGIRTPSGILVAFKAVCRAGPEVLYGIFMESKSMKAKDSDNSPPEDELLQGFNPESGVYESDSYYQFYNLICHQQTHSVNVNSWIAYTLTKLLRAKSEFFQEIPTCEVNEFQHFVGTALLRHIDSVPYNCMSMWEENHIEVYRRDKALSPTRAVYEETNHDLDDDDAPSLVSVFSVCSLMCHSCDASAIRVNTHNGTLAIVASRDLTPGDEITISYGFEYHLNTKAERAVEAHKYQFDCNCPACTFDWPTIADMDPKLKFLCPTCGPKYSYQWHTQNNKCNLVMVDNESWKAVCQHCGEKFDWLVLIDEARKFLDLCHEAKCRVDEGKPLESIPMLIKCIQYFQSHLVIPSKGLASSQALLSVAYDLVAGSPEENYF